MCVWNISSTTAAACCDRLQRLLSQPYPLSHEIDQICVPVVALSGPDICWGGGGGGGESRSGEKGGN